MKREAHPENWLQITPQGLYCRPGDFFIDPHRPVERAVITHGHADHARPDHHRVLATAETLAIIQTRYGDRAGHSFQALKYGESIELGETRERLVPAGHVLGSAQVVGEWGGWRVVVAGDCKRPREPTCAPQEMVTCDALVTAATSSLPALWTPPALEVVERA